MKCLSVCTVCRAINHLQLLVVHIQIHAHVHYSWYTVKLQGSDISFTVDKIGLELSLVKALFF